MYENDLFNYQMIYVDYELCCMVSNHRPYVKFLYVDL